MLWDGLYFCGWGGEGGNRARVVSSGFVLEVVWVAGKMFWEIMA